ncbi:MAG: cell surface protein, partial [Planctomycetaceae bacterium]
MQSTAPEGVTRDVTAEAKCVVLDPKVARFEQAAVHPVADGRTELRVVFADQTNTVPIVVTNATVQRPISFKLDVMPVFTKAGCNAGSCHGTSRGKDGFHLSLFGFDPDGDYHRLTREQIGRRINLAIPDESLIVQKGLGAVQHTGGVRFDTNSELCQILLQWLRVGATNDPPTLPSATGIDIFPKTAVLEGSNSV